MKLTAEQIIVIEQTLVLNGLKFDDLKLELTDHIASEIEELMNTNSLCIEENLKLVLSKWSEQLRPSSSLWFNNNGSNPTLGTYKFNEMIKPVMLHSALTSLLISILFTVITRNWHSKFVLNCLNSGFKIISISVFFLLVFAWYMIWKSKHITTYGYWFNKNVVSQMIFLFFLSMGIYPFRIYTSSFGADLLFNFFPFSILFLSIFYLKLAYKHLQFNKKLSISNS